MPLLNYAERMEKLKVSEVREIIKFIMQPGIISFAGGIPDGRLFPMEAVADISQKVLNECGAESLQYASSEGYIPLREQIKQRMAKYGIQSEVENILLLNGAQQGIEFSGRILLDQGDIVLCESPTYLGALNAYKTYQCDFKEVPCDEDGIIPEELEKILKTVPNIKMIYTVPDYQNPTGRQWTLERRQQFMEVVNRHHLPVVEDSPYYELRYDGESLPPLKALDTKGLVIYLGSFSKIFCPGLRMGWVCADRNILQNFILAKQSCDLQGNTFAERQVSFYLRDYDIQAHIEEVRKTYKYRRDVMQEMIESEFPKNIKNTAPKGGTFIWVELPTDVNAREVLQEAVKKNVAFIPGGSFYPESNTENAMRLSFVSMDEQEIRKGMKLLGQVLKTFI